MGFQKNEADSASDVNLKSSNGIKRKPDDESSSDENVKSQKRIKIGEEVWEVKKKRDAEIKNARMKKIETLDYILKKARKYNEKGLAEIYKQEPFKQARQLVQKKGPDEDLYRIYKSTLLDDKEYLKNEHDLTEIIEVGGLRRRCLKSEFNSAICKPAVVTKEDVEWLQENEQLLNSRISSEENYKNQKDKSCDPDETYDIFKLETEGYDEIIVIFINLNGVSSKNPKQLQSIAEKSGAHVIGIVETHHGSKYRHDKKTTAKELQRLLPSYNLVHQPCDCPVPNRWKAGHGLCLFYKPCFTVNKQNVKMIGTERVDHRQLAATFKTSNGLSFHVVLVHYKSGHSLSRIDAATKKAQLRSTIRHLKHYPENEPVMCGGDLNLHPTWPEFGEAVHAFKSIGMTVESFEQVFKLNPTEYTHVPRMPDWKKNCLDQIVYRRLKRMIGRVDLMKPPDFVLDTDHPHFFRITLSPNENNYELPLETSIFDDYVSCPTCGRWYENRIPSIHQNCSYSTDEEIANKYLDELKNAKRKEHKTKENMFYKVIEKKKAQSVGNEIAKKMLRLRDTWNYKRVDKDKLNVMGVFALHRKYAILKIIASRTIRRLTNKYYNCKDCEKVFSKLRGLCVHVRRHLKKTVWKCNICKNVYTTKKLLQTHQQFHKEDYIQACEKCDRNFPTIYELRSHILIDHGLKPYNCQVCRKSFMFQLALIDHMNTHSKNKLYVCKICEMVVHTRRRIVYHIKSKHRNHPGIFYECKNCCIKYSSYYDLVRHQIINHPKEYPCEKCNKVFKSSNALNTHRRQVHSKTKHCCDSCNLVFDSKVSLIKHQRQALKKLLKMKPDNDNFSTNRMIDEHSTLVGKQCFKLVCKICSKGFESIFTYKRHYFKMHKAKCIKVAEYVCSECSKCFNKIHSLKRHGMTHKSPLQPSEKNCRVELNCNHCSKKFKEEKVLKRHVTMKHGIWCCRMCGDNFNSEGKLSRHRLTKHKGPPKICCQQCPKKFFSNNDLQRHLKHHQNQSKKAFDPAYMFACNKCEKKFKNRRCLQGHIRESHGVYDCNICPEKCQTFNGLRQHKMVKHGVPPKFRCQECQKCFLGKKLLDLHSKSHQNNLKKTFQTKEIKSRSSSFIKITEQSETTPFNCAKCPMKFSGSNEEFLDHLKNHQNQHELISEARECVAACGKCGKKFASVKVLKLHLKNRHGNFKCEICSVEFESYFHYNRHKLVTHSGPPKFSCTGCQKKWFSKKDLNSHFKIHQKHSTNRKT